MNEADLRARLIRAADICHARGISQAQVAEAVGASQSQVSRILAGQHKRASRLAEEICLFIERFHVGVTADAVRRSDELIEAVRCVWDGSASHARALSTVICSLSALRSPALSTEEHQGDSA